MAASLPVRPGEPGYAGGGGGDDGGGGRRGPGRGSRAEMLSSTLPTSWNKNVLEVTLDKDEAGAFNVSQIDCAKMMRKIGLVGGVGGNLEEVQICPNGRGVILFTLKKEAQIGNFCTHDVLEITASGIRATNFKPAGKREVVVNLKNIHPNTMDEGVMEYLNKFGKIVTKKVIYGVYGEGPLCGLRNVKTECEYWDIPCSGWPESHHQVCWAAPDLRQVS